MLPLDCAILQQQESWEAEIRDISTSVCIDSYFIQVLHSSSGFSLAPAKPHTASHLHPRSAQRSYLDALTQVFTGTCYSAVLDGVYPTLCPILQFFVSCSGALAKCRKIEIIKTQHHGIFKYIIKVQQLGSLFSLLVGSISRVKSPWKPVFSTKHFISNPKILTHPSQQTVHLLSNVFKLQFRTLSNKNKLPMLKNCLHTQTEEQFFCLVYCRAYWWLNIDNCTESFISLELLMIKLLSGKLQ